MRFSGNANNYSVGGDFSELEASSVWEVSDDLWTWVLCNPWSRLKDCIAETHTEKGRQLEHVCALPIAGMGVAVLPSRMLFFITVAE